MGSLDSTLVADGPLFLADFGESVTYTPLGVAAKVITGLVERESPQSIAGAGQSAAMECSVWIQNHPTLGVSSINVGGDTITVANRQGGIAKARTVDGIISQDAGMWHLRLR